MKHPLSKAYFHFDPAVLIRALLDADYQELAMTGQHSIAAAALPHLHIDPLDRMLIAQIITKSFILVTSNLAIAKRSTRVQSGTSSKSSSEQATHAISRRPGNRGLPLILSSDFPQEVPNSYQTRH